jgi:threonine dehydrogenase-like Zn-dependent dehydrogenase
MSDKTPLCTGQSYRGVVIMTIHADGESRVVVVGTAHRQAVQLFECESMSEAYALVDAALTLEAADNLPGLDGGARAVVYGDGPIQTV